MTSSNIVSDNGIESFWSMLKRGYYGTYHQMSERFQDGTMSGNMYAVEQMARLATSLVGKQLLYRDLVREDTAA